MNERYDYEYQDLMAGVLLQRKDIFQDAAQDAAVEFFPFNVFNCFVPTRWLRGQYRVTLKHIKCQS